MDGKLNNLYGYSCQPVHLLLEIGLSVENGIKSEFLFERRL
jgi:hypothetical protein